MDIKIRDSRFVDGMFPMMITLTKKDKHIIKNMHEDATRYAVVPGDGSWSYKEMDAWMDVPGIPVTHFERES